MVLGVWRRELGAGEDGMFGIRGGVSAGVQFGGWEGMVVVDILRGGRVVGGGKHGV